MLTFFIFFIQGEELDDDEVPELAPEQERGMLHNVIGDILGEKTSDEEEESDGEENGKEESDDEVMEFDEDEEESEYDEEMSDAEEGSGKESEELEESEEEGPVANGGDMFSRKSIKNNKSEQNAAVERLERRTEQIAAALEGAGKREPPPPGASVFVRGLALDITKDQLFTAMRAYGPVASARLVVDKSTGNPKGTAFVDFRIIKAAEAVVAACAKGRQKAGPGVLVAGKKVDVDLALDSDGARNLAAEKVLGVGADGKDRRNLYLAQEGAIPEDSAAWEGLSTSDKAKRKRGVEEARTKLRSPNFSVSRTRLNVRNVPRTLDEKKLKAMFIAAVKERATKANPKVIQVKVLREDGVDGDKGVGRSKGIAFVEFDDHEHALCALRQLNNNPKPWGKDTRPIVEFAIDDVRTLKKREARQAKSPGGGQAAAARGAAAGVEEKPVVSKKAKKKAAEEEDVEEGPKSKRKLRSERRRMLKERQRAKQNKPAAATESSPASAGGANKSQRRREQRKKNKEGQNGTVAPDSGPKTAVKLPSKADVDRTKGAKVQTKKERADGLVDKLASAGVAEGGVVKKRRRDTDRVERLAEAYVARTYGDGVPKKKSNSSKEAQHDKKRWFQDE